MGIVTRVNDWIALNVTSAVGTMWCTYAFIALSLSWFLVPAFATWVSQNFIQLVLLPLLMVGQRVQAERISDLHDKHDQLHDLVRAGTRNLRGQFGRPFR